MKKIISLLVLVLLIPIFSVQAKNSSWTENEIIAHAMGGIKNYSYTNSYESFIANYEKGFRVFEVDFQLTSDGYLVARHDWDNVDLYKHYNQTPPPNKIGKPLTIKEFNALKIHDILQPLSFGQIVGLMKLYPDVYIVTDTKDLDNEVIANQFQVLVRKAKQIDKSTLNRIIPQLYNQDMYNILEDIYPFKSYIYTLYATQDKDDQVIDFVNKTPKVDAITMSEFRVNSSIVQRLNKLGVKSYVHTINDMDIYEKYKEMGVTGIYTDFISSKDIEIAELKKQVMQ